MQTSTPLAGTSGRKSLGQDLRRTALLRDITNSATSPGTPSPPKKRLSNLVNQSITSATEVDDELERMERRNEAEMQRRLSTLSSISTPRSPQLCDEKEIRNHFQICIKMFTENKISAKNAWNLKIIDYMRTILHSSGLSKDSLQVASTSLDVSAKIYGIRVDDIHAESLKLASSMARVSAQRQMEAEGDGDGAGEEGEDGDNENEGPSKKKKKRRMFSGKKMTVVKDPNTLLADVPKLESVFFQTRLNLESSCIDNLFTNKLPMNHARYKFMLMSKEKWWPSYLQPDPNVICDKKYPFTIKDEKAEPIHLAFAGFEIDEWDPDQEALQLNAQAETDKTVINDDVVFDAEGIPIPELDGSVHDLFAAAGADGHGGSSDEEECHTVGHDAVMTNQVSHIVDFRPQENGASANDYSYASTLSLHGNKLITQVWAGPSHWKLKHIRRNTSKFTGQQDKQVGKSVKKNRVIPSLIDFNCDYPRIDMTKIYKVKRYRIDEAPVKCTLPEVFNENPDLYQSLMLKPVFISTNRKKPTTDAEVPDVQPYNYENPNDSHYCAENNHEDNEPYEDDGGDHEEEHVDPQQNFLADNLVNAPEMVPKTFMHYAMQAKKMDMKKLKTAVWKSLVCDKPNEIVPDDGMFKKEVPRRQFSTIYKQLPNRITDKMQQELSPALAFVALLHLTNEQNLKLTSHADLKDITIEQTKHFVP